MIFQTEGATQAQVDEARQIIEVLSMAYPNHPWAVRVYDGGFFIQHMDFDPKWGMNCKVKDFAYSASQMKREIIMKAGEWLERANLKRGFGDESPIKHVEGVPEKYQPFEYREQAAPAVPLKKPEEWNVRDEPLRKEEEQQGQTDSG